MAWEKVADTFDGMTDLSNPVIFNDRIYAAGSYGDGRLIRLNSAGDAWEQVAAQYGSIDDYYELYVFNNRLYAAASNSGELMRLNLAGNAWEEAAPDPGDNPTCLISYNSQLYVGTQHDGKLYKYNSGTGALDLVCDEYANVPTIDRIHFLAVLDSRLYGSTDEGILLRLNDDLNAWELAADGQDSRRVWHLVVFNDELYGAAEDGVLLQKYNTSTSSWDTVVGSYGSETELSRIFVYHGRIFACSSPGGKLLKINDNGNGFDLVCDSLDSQEWVAGICVLNNDIYATMGWDGYLYRASGLSVFSADELKASPSIPGMIKIDESKMCLISKYHPLSFQKSKLLVTDFQGYETNDVDIYEDILFNN